MKYEQKYCSECEQNRKTVLSKSSSGCVAPFIILMMSLFLGLIFAPLGLALLILGLVCIYSNKGKWMCDYCGSDKVK